MVDFVIVIRDFFNGLVEELQYILLGLILLVVGILLPRGLISFIVGAVGIFLMGIGIGKVIEKLYG